jgi:hypothetical protein
MKWMLFVIVTTLALPAFGQASEKPAALLGFQITEFKSVVEKYSLQGRGMVRHQSPEFRNRIVGVRLRYVLRLRNEPYTYSSTVWVVLTNGAGLVEVNAFVPDAILNTLRTEKDYAVFEWSVDGWFFMNPGKVTGS